MLACKFFNLSTVSLNRTLIDSSILLVLKRRILYKYVLLLSLLLLLLYGQKEEKLFNDFNCDNANIDIITNSTAIIRQLLRLHRAQLL